MKIQILPKFDILHGLGRQWQNPAIEQLDQALGASEETAITEEDSVQSVQTVHSWRPEGSRKYGERGNDSDSKDLMHLKLVFDDEEKLFNEEYRDRKS